MACAGTSSLLATRQQQQQQRGAESGDAARDASIAGGWQCHASSPELHEAARWLSTRAGRDGAHTLQNLAATGFWHGTREKNQLCEETLVETERRQPDGRSG
ncbi:unnamed protein product [Lampetra planeri]